jgi:tellurium resistance protein TerD
MTYESHDGKDTSDTYRILKVYFSKIPSCVCRIPIVLSIYDANKRNQKFSDLQSVYSKIYERSTNREVVEFSLTGGFSDETSIIICEIYKHLGQWRFGAIGRGFKSGLDVVCKHYGLNTE